MPAWPVSWSDNFLENPDMLLDMSWNLTAVREKMRENMLRENFVVNLMFMAVGIGILSMSHDCYTVSNA